MKNPTSVYMLAGWHPEGLSCQVNYSNAHISGVQAQSLFGDFTRLLEHVGKKDLCVDQLWMEGFNLRTHT